MSKNTQRYIILIAVAIVIAAAAFCIYLFYHQAPPPKPLTKEQLARQDSIALKVAVMPTAACLPFYYAQETGIYKSLGLKVKIVTYRAQMDCDTALQNKRVECAYTDIIRAAYLQSKHVGLHVFMQPAENWYLITAREKRVKQIGQLKEKMIAMARFSVTDYMIDAIIGKAKIKSDDIYRPQINDVALRYDMLCNGELDAVILPEPYAESAVRQGHRSIFSLDSLQIEMAAMAVRSDISQNTTRASQISLLVKGYNMAAQRLNRLRYMQQTGRSANHFNIAVEVRDSIRLAHYPQAHSVNAKSIAAAVAFLHARNLVPASYKGDTLQTSKFLKL
jgi:NitT/TauT family transport system substrate-binding protein